MARSFAPLTRTWERDGCWPVSPRGVSVARVSNDPVSTRMLPSFRIGSDQSSASTPLSSANASQRATDTVMMAIGAGQVKHHPENLNRSCSSQTETVLALTVLPQHKNQQQPQSQSLGQSRQLHQQHRHLNHSSPPRLHHHQVSLLSSPVKF